MDKSFTELLAGYVNNSLSKEELALFLALLQQENHQGSVKQQIEDLLKDQSFSGLSDQDRAGMIFKTVIDKAKSEEEQRSVVYFSKQSKRFFILRLAAAASIISFLALGIYFLKKKDTKEIAKTEVKSGSYKNDVMPGGTKAVLTLSDGSTIVLNEAKNGALAQQGNTKVIKLNEKLAYVSAEGNTKESLYNTLSTPRGGQYQIELPDGTRVWLNAASSLRFPTAFNGKERTVTITGEAYFEVTKNKFKPFVVTVNQARVRVMGTHFSIMAYGDEPVVKTTLLEGAVSFTNAGAEKILKAGQQSQLARNGQLNVTDKVNLEEVMAWKNGLFYFEGADIKTVMQELSRWYDVEIVYNKKVDDLFYVEMSRNTKLSDILRVLELSGNLKLDIQGKKIIILP